MHGPPSQPRVAAPTAPRGAAATCALALATLDGISRPKDDREACRLFRLAAEQGSVEAWGHIARLADTAIDFFKVGDPVPDHRIKKAVAVWRAAAEKGDAAAQRFLGFCYSIGVGVPKNPAEAVRLYRLSADQGYAQAQCNLGFCYHTSLGVPQDYAEAVRLYRLSADQGYPLAQNNLGKAYYDGQGVIRDYTEAARFYRLSADRGHAPAIYMLGECYLSRKRVDWNPEMAIMYFTRSLNQGYNARYRIEAAKRERSRLGWNIKRHGFLTTAFGRNRVAAVLLCASRLRLDDSEFALPIMPLELWLLVLGQLSLRVIDT
eukprot:m.56543 g.56543  ORF g.56543 m.56543 type:complete len:319 (+) comp9307_c0_seq2:39-995(+)